jgi:hypothetical protein
MKQRQPQACFHQKRAMRFNASAPGFPLPKKAPGRVRPRTNKVNPVARMPIKSRQSQRR